MKFLPFSATNAAIDHEIMQQLCCSLPNDRTNFIAAQLGIYRNAVMRFPPKKGIGIERNVFLGGQFSVRTVWNCGAIFKGNKDPWCFLFFFILFCPWYFYSSSFYFIFYFILDIFIRLYFILYFILDNFYSSLFHLILIYIFYSWYFSFFFILFHILFYPWYFLFFFILFHILYYSNLFLYIFYSLYTYEW